jgi:hypothetical protein
MEGKPYVKTLRVPYHQELRDAESVAKTVTQFLGAPLDIEEIVRQVDARCVGTVRNQLWDLVKRSGDDSFL